MTICNCVEFQFNSPVIFMNAIDIMNMRCIFKYLARWHSIG